MRSEFGGKRILFCMMLLVGFTLASALPTMVSISAGTFQMGSTNLDVTPVHSVTLGAFTMSQTLVTQTQYQAVMDTNPSMFDSGRTWPVEGVNWYDAALFCNALSKQAGLDTVYTYAGIYRGSGYDTLMSVAIDYSKNGYRLPTEAEYEYAYRAGTKTDYYWGRNYPPITHADTLAIDSNAVWYYDDTPYGTHQVASKKPNAWGLYDMAGNLMEWCNDRYGSYSSAADTNPTGPTSGSSRMCRGGQWIVNYADYLCAAYRGTMTYPAGEYGDVGFRVVIGARAPSPLLPERKMVAPQTFSLRNGTIEYFLNEQSPVEIRIYDLLGKKIFEFNRVQSSGNYSFSVKTLNLSSELYIMHFKAGNFEKQFAVMVK